jgi:hypothetical protein
MPRPCVLATSVVELSQKSSSTETVPGPSFVVLQLAPSFSLVKRPTSVHA